MVGDYGWQYHSGLTDSAMSRDVIFGKSVPEPKKPYIPPKVECPMCFQSRFTLEKDKWGDWVPVYTCPGCGSGLPEG